MTSITVSERFFSDIGKSFDRNLEQNTENASFIPPALTAYPKTFPTGEKCTSCGTPMNAGDEYVIKPGRVLCRSCSAKEDA